MAGKAGISSLRPSPGGRRIDGAHRTVLVVLFDDVQSLDVTGPAEVFAGAEQHTPGTYRIRTASLDGAPVRTSSGLTDVPDLALAKAPVPDTLTVPGGRGSQNPDPRLVEWLRGHGTGARRLVSVCTGAILLAAEGLLTGRRATSYWLALDLLVRFGVEPTGERVVTDGKYVTAAGVSSGIDMGLTPVGRIAGDEHAQAVQPLAEYDPRPPCDAGSPEKAPAHLVEEFRVKNRFIQT
ncbi:DJ-1/PfpI family protein [Streptomyces sp. NPDC097107]|uniref:DJ-1/PfpI family protein n=1 Tax=Streptomyces sp. NPDC097107 TaxID=3366089 RepID=UPI003825E1C7